MTDTKAKLPKERLKFMLGNELHNCRQYVYQLNTDEGYKNTPREKSIYRLLFLSRLYERLFNFAEFEKNEILIA